MVDLSQNGQNPSPGNGKRIPYDVIRDRFLAKPPKTAEQDLLYFTEIGLFVFDRWQQIANDHNDGDTIDESACDHRWDECTEKDLREFKTRATDTVKAEIKRRRALAFVQSWMAKFDSISGIAKVISWFLMEAVRGFVGAIGILIFGLLFLYLSPTVSKAFRAAIDDIAPQETRPNPSFSGQTTTVPGR
jgi:hypothetical protein